MVLWNRKGKGVNQETGALALHCCVAFNKPLTTPESHAKGIPTLSSEPSVLGIIWPYCHKDIVLYLLEACFSPASPNLGYFIGDVGLNQLLPSESVSLGNMGVFSLFSCTESGTLCLFLESCSTFTGTGRKKCTETSVQPWLPLPSLLALGRSGFSFISLSQGPTCL